MKNTVCPDDDRNIQEFDDHYYNDEWDHSHADWTKDFQITAAPCATDIFHECHDSFDSDNARIVLAGHVTTPLKSVMCVYATPSVEAKAAADYWEVKGNKLIRHHICPRTNMYTLSTPLCPRAYKEALSPMFAAPRCILRTTLATWKSPTTLPTN